MSILEYAMMAALAVTGCDRDQNPVIDGSTTDADAAPDATPLPCGFRDPTLGDGDLVTERNVIYSELTDAFGVHTLRLDITRPASGPARPGIVWIHGGFFTQGQRTQLDRFVRESARRGYVATTIDYRLRKALDPGATTQEAIWTAQSDAQAAARYLRANATTFGLDASRIVMAGFSAGGLTTLAAAYDYDTIGANDDNTTNPGFPHRPQFAITLDSMNPNATMLPGDPPFVVFRATEAEGGSEPTGAGDEAQAKMTALAAEHGVLARFHSVEGANHSALIDPMYTPQISTQAANFLCDAGIGE